MIAPYSSNVPWADSLQLCYEHLDTSYTTQGIFLYSPMTLERMRSSRRRVEFVTNRSSVDKPLVT